MTEGIADGYTLAPGVFDEMLQPDGTPREPWARLLGTADFGSAETLEGRWREAERQIRENGITYNVYGDPRGLARPWPLDPLPLAIMEDEWQQIEAGLIQRAQLIEYVLGDIYGPQNLVRNGLIAPGAIFSNPGFLRPCHGVAAPDGTNIHFMAVDLGRTQEGDWVVLSDRTQAPSGAGYTLENRMVTTRCLAEAFGSQPVRRLAGFFKALRDNLNRAASMAARRSRGTGGDPRVVLLTPGSYNETYFEHAYLARYLGYPLVAGEDLTVRYDRVYLKTLSGLQPVDGILRRLDDDYCDPLWLKPDSALGVPGLVTAARRGHVAICNRLGSGVIEAAALMGCLPDIARHHFGEELLLRQQETHWLGTSGSFDALRGDLDDFVIKPAFPNLPMEPIFCSALDDEAREALEQRIARKPYAYVAQRRINLSRSPVWRDHKITSCPLVLRAYIAASGDDWVVMPGGLTRVSRRPGEPIVSLQAGGGSKDTWIVAREPVEAVTLWPAQSDTAALRRTATADLPSRVADNLFWLGRYVERTEFTLRLARAAMNRHLPDSALGNDAAQPLLKCLREFGVPSPATLNTATLLTAFDEGLPPILMSLYRMSATIRDRLSLDAWRLLSPLGAPPGLSGRPSGAAASEIEAWLTRIAAFNGLAMENMTRGLGWRFLELGRRVERAIQTAAMARILCSIAGSAQTAALEALLEICDSSMTYRGRYFAGLRADAVLDLVICDESNPRAIAFQLVAINEHLHHLPRERQGNAATPEHRMAAACLAELRRTDMRRLTETVETAGSGVSHPGLDKFAATLAADLASLSDVLSEAYFKHAIPALVAHGPASIAARN